MKKVCLLFNLIFLVLIGSLQAQNSKPDHAAQIRHSGEELGTTCILHDADYNEYTSNECGWQSVLKFEKDGSFKFFKYHDQGQLPEGAILPKNRIEFTDEGITPLGDYFFLREIVMPSGKYVSSYIERPSGS